MSKYSPKIDLDNSNTSHSKIINLVGKNKKVIEFGCAAGHMSEILLRQFNCEIVGLEIDEQEAQKASLFCKEVIVGDIESLDWDTRLSGTFFDVALFSDVLEHLKDPNKILYRVKELLAKDGYILISVPNIAHLSIRLELLSGGFEYENLGILDRSHLKYFTAKSIIQLVEEAGFFIDFLDYVVKDLPNSIVQDSFKLLDLIPTQKTIDKLSTIDALAFQWIVKASNQKLKNYIPFVFFDNVKPEREAEKLIQLHLELTEKANERLLQADKWLHDKDQVIQEKIDQISQKDQQLQEQTIQLQEQTIQLQEQTIQLQEQTIQLQEQTIELQQKDLQIQEQRIQIQNIISEFTLIKNSRVWRIAEFFRTLIYIKLLGKFPSLQEAALSCSRQGIKGFYQIVLNKFSNQNKIKKCHISENEIERLKNKTKIKAIKKKISLIIPTKNAGPDFAYTIEKIKGQKGIREVELIIIDSGSNDETISLAEKNGAFIYKIIPEEFNHGLTRNFGASRATGEYLLFLVQDAIPIGEYWLYNILKKIEYDPKIAAVTCRQIPKSNADLFACSSIWNHYKYLQFNKDKIIDIGKEEFVNLSFAEKRKFAVLDDVCSCYKRAIFEKFKFRETNYAEDLDLGIRFIEKGYKIFFLYSSGVIHSHSRDPEYFLRRSYVDTRSLTEISKQPPSIVFNDGDGVLGDLSYIYQALRGILYSVILNFQNDTDIDRIFSEIKGGLFVKNQDAVPEQFPVLKFADLIFHPEKMSDPINSSRHHILLEDFISLLSTFENYLKSTNKSYPAKDLIDPIYKFFSIFCGSSLGYSFFYDFTNNKMIHLEESLSRDV